MPIHKADDHIVAAQLICFLGSSIMVIQALVIHGPVTEVLVKVNDALFMTGTTLLSLKLARDGWEMTAAGFIILTIGWGVLFAAADNLGKKIGYDNLASAFYFVAPAMILIAFYKPFKFWVRLLLIINIIPFLLSLAFKIAESKSNIITYLSVINILFMHIVSLIWSIHFFVEHRKLKRNI